MIVVYRRGELPKETEAGLIAVVESGIAVKISIEALETNAIGTLLEGLGLEDSTDLVQGLSRYTGGNPLFILETALVLRGNAFTHDLLFEATLTGIPGAIKQVLHGDTARYLETINSDAARIAQHWLEASNTDKAAHWLLEAAKQAGALGLHSDATELRNQSATLLAGRINRA